jgi:hypothetical protein
VVVAPNRKVREVQESLSAALDRDLTVHGVAADHMRDLHIQQVRRVQRLARVEQP